MSNERSPGMKEKQEGGRTWSEFLTETLPSDPHLMSLYRTGGGFKEEGNGRQ